MEIANIFTLDTHMQTRTPVSIVNRYVLMYLEKCHLNVSHKLLLGEGKICPMSLQKKLQGGTLFHIHIDS